MNTIYTEALQKGHQWAAKYAPAPPKPEARKEPTRKWTPEALALRRETNRLHRERVRLSRNAAFFPMIRGMLLGKGWVRAQPIAEECGVSFQRLRSLVGDMEIAGIVKRWKGPEALWLAMNECPYETPDHQIAARKAATTKAIKAKPETSGTRSGGWEGAPTASHRNAQRKEGEAWRTPQ